MFKVIRIDNDGFYLEDVLVETLEILDIDLISTPCKDGFYLPRWNGEKWIEGKTEEEIEYIKNLNIPQPTSEEILAQTLVEVQMDLIEKNNQLEQMAQTIAEMQIGGMI